MKIFSFKNCLSTILSLGCLTVILIVIFALIFYRNIKNDKPLFFFNNIIEIPEPNKQEFNQTNLYPKNKNEVLKILLISDTEDFWMTTQQALEQGKNEQVDFVIHLGDVTHLGVPEKLSEAKDLFEKSDLKIYPVPGDRDLWKSRQSSDGLKAFNDVFGQSYRFIESGGYGFLLIDNSNIYEGIDDKQWDFITKNIQEADFVFMHNPIYFNKSYLLGDKGMGQYSQDVEEQRLKLLDLVRESDVKAVFAGNQHYFSETNDSEKTALNHYVVGSLNKERNLEIPNFSILYIYEDGDFYLRKISLN